MSIENGATQENPESEQTDIVFCEDCGCAMLYNFDYEIESELLYIASGGYDGVRQDEWFECPGCGNIA